MINHHSVTGEKHIAEEEGFRDLWYYPPHRQALSRTRWSIDKSVLLFADDWSKCQEHTCVTDAFSLGGVRHINLSVRRGICHKSQKWQFCKIFSGSGKIFKNFRHINISALVTCWERWLFVLKTNMFTTSNQILSVSVFFIYHFCSYIRKPNNFLFQISSSPYFSFPK